MENPGLCSLATKHGGKLIEIGATWMIIPLQTILEHPNEHNLGVFMSMYNIS
jgi:hypothetical protein